MPKLIKNISAIFALLVLLSCGSGNKLIYEESKNEIKNVAIFEPLSHVELIENKNKKYYDDSTTDIAKQTLKSAINDLKMDLKISEVLRLNNDALAQKVSLEIDTLTRNGLKAEGNQTVKITKLLDSLLEAKGQRFGMIAFTTGYLRTEENFSKKLSKNITLAGFSNIFDREEFPTITVKVPKMAQTNLYIIVLDAQENHISYFNRLSIEDSPPTNKSVVKLLLEQIMETLYKK